MYPINIRAFTKIHIALMTLLTLKALFSVKRDSMCGLFNHSFTSSLSVRMSKLYIQIRVSQGFGGA